MSSQSGFFCISVSISHRNSRAALQQGLISPLWNLYATWRSPDRVNTLFLHITSLFTYLLLLTFLKVCSFLLIISMLTNQINCVQQITFPYLFLFFLPTGTYSLIRNGGVLLFVSSFVLQCGTYRNTGSGKEGLISTPGDFQATFRSAYEVDTLYYVYSKTIIFYCR